MRKALRVVEMTFQPETGLKKLQCEKLMTQSSEQKKMESKLNGNKIKLTIKKNFTKMFLLQTN